MTLLPLPPDRTSRRIAFGFMAVLLLVAAGFVLSFYKYSQYNHASEEAGHSYQVINTLEGVLSLMKDAETGTRGYLISGDPLFLEPYTVARHALPGRMAELRQLLADTEDPQQTAMLTRLIDTSLSINERQIQGRRTSQATTQAYLLNSKANMDRVRQQTQRMTVAERQRMQTRNAGVNVLFRHTLLVTLALLVLAFVALLQSYNLLESELTRRQRNEDKLRSVEEDLTDRIRQLESSNEELERFAFVASHDLQEPLRKIQSFAALLTERYEPLLDGEGRVFLGKMMQSADRMSKLIKDLLTFSRLSAPKEEVRAVPIADLVQRVLDDQELRIQTLNARIEVGALPVIQAVPGQIDHLFANLIANALKFTRPGTAPLVQIQAQAVDGGQYPELIPGRKYYQFVIADNGIGFDEKYTDHIFKVFQRLHGRSVYEGTGIGLAICKKVVMNHKGFITARSQPDAGATFVVVLPEKQTSDFHDRAIPDKTYSYSAG